MSTENTVEEAETNSLMDSLFFNPVYKDIGSTLSIILLFYYLLENNIINTVIYALITIIHIFMLKNGNIILVIILAIGLAYGMATT